MSFTLSAAGLGQCTLCDPLSEVLEQLSQWVLLYGLMGLGGYRDVFCLVTRYYYVLTNLFAESSSYRAIGGFEIERYVLYKCSP